MILPRLTRTGSPRDEQICEDLRVFTRGSPTYQVSTDKRSGITSDPNRADDEQYIVRLVGQVIRVSLETVKIVSSLPAEFEPR